MGNFRTVKTFFLMELKKLIKNQKLIISVFVTPIAISVFMIYGITSILDKENNYSIEIYVADEQQKSAVEALEAKYDKVVCVVGRADRSKISSGDTDIFIEVTDGVEVVYDSSAIKNTTALFLAKEIANEVNMMLFEAELYGEYVNEMPLVDEKDIGTQEERARAVISVLFVLMLILAVTMANNAVTTLTGDSVSGEKERGIFDSYRLSGTSVSSIVAGKALFAACATILVYMAELGAAVAAIWAWNPELMKLINAQIDVVGIISIAVVIAENSILATALFMIVCAFCDKLRQASSYGNIVTDIVSFSAALPLVTEHPAVSYVPIINFAKVSIDAICGKNNTAALIVSGVITVIASILAYYTASQVMERGISNDKS